jgi:hypothetical protein
VTTHCCSQLQCSQPQRLRPHLACQWGCRPARRSCKPPPHHFWRGSWLAQGALPSPAGQPGRLLLPPILLLLAACCAFHPLWILSGMPQACLCGELL